MRSSGLPVNEDAHVFAPFQVDDKVFVPVRILRVFHRFRFGFLEKVAVEIHLDAHVDICNAKNYPVTMKTSEIVNLPQVNSSPVMS